MKNRATPLGVGIIGCGLIGHKRADALGAGGQLVACADKDIERTTTLAKKTAAEACKDWQQLLEFLVLFLFLAA